MEKKKINMTAKEPDVVVKQAGEDEIRIFTFIPCEKKEAFVEELLMQTAQADESLGVLYKGNNYPVIYTYLFVKYYTDVDVDGKTPREVFDWLYSHFAWHEIRDIAWQDLCVIDEMTDKLFEACKTTYEKEHSLELVAKKMLSEAPLDTDNAETRELIEKLVDMKGALMEKEQNRVKMGGAIVNLARKK